jgi:hypothetical protein
MRKGSIEPAMNLQRTLSKINYHIQTDAIKEKFNSDATPEPLAAHEKRTKHTDNFLVTVKELVP